MRYVTGDATLPQGAGGKLIVHVVNDQGGWGKGFVVALSARYPAAEEAYRRWSRRPAADDPPFALGQVQFVPVPPHLWIANLLAQHGYRRPDNPVPLDYAALDQGLEAVAVFAGREGMSIHLPKIGAGLAGGDWDRIAALIDRRLAGHDVTVYER